MAARPCTSSPTYTYLEITDTAMAKATLTKLAADTPVDEVIRVLERDGGLILTNLIPQSTLDQIAIECKPFEQPDQVWKGDFFPEATKRICGAFGKSPTFAKEIFGNPLYVEVCDRLLTMTKKSRIGDKMRTFVCKPVGNASTVFDIGPGAEAQVLHRDDGVHHLEHPLPKPTQISMLVAQTRTTTENGATVVIPGSHKWVCLTTKGLTRLLDTLLIPCCSPTRACKHSHHVQKMPFRLVSSQEMHSSSMVPSSMEVVPTSQPQSVEKYVEPLTLVVIRIRC